MTGWRTTNLGTIATLQRGFDLPHRLRQRGTVPVVSSSGTTGWHNRAMVKAPGVVTGRYGTIGEVFYQEVDFWPLNTTLWVSNFHGNDERYVYYLLHQIDFATHSGKSGVPGVNRNDLHLELVSLPESTAEQRTIADAFRDCDDLTAALERHIVKKQAIKQGMMQQLLTGLTRLPGFAAPWTTTSLGAIGTFLKGRGIKRDDVQPNGIPCIRYGELYTVFNDYTSEARSFVTPAVAKTALPLEPGDLLFTGSGETHDEIGKCIAYIGETPAVAGGDLIVLRGAGFNPVYLALLANTPTVANQKARAGQGDAVVHISSRALAEVRIDMPPLDEQNTIASVILDADRELTSLRNRLDKARYVKQGMMQQLLTGRVRLPVREATL